MKILKAGSMPTITANVSCRFCKAELEIVPSDVHKNKADFPAYKFLSCNHPFGEEV